MLASQVGMEVPKQEATIDTSSATKINNKAAEILYEQQKTNDGFNTPQMVTEIPKRAEDSLLKKLDETEGLVLEAVKPLREILLKLSLRLEALESRHEIKR